MKLTRVFYSGKYSKLLVCLVLLIAISLMMSISYAYYTFYAVQEDENIVVTDCFKLVFSSHDDIMLNNTMPIKESDALELTPYTFTIKNVCNQAQNYDVTIEDLNNTTLDLNYVRFKLDSDASHILGEISPNISKILDNSNNSRTIRTAIIMPGEEFTYSLRMWVDENATINQVQNTTFKSKIIITSNMNRNPYKIITLLPGEGYLESNTLNIVNGRLVGYLPTPSRNGYTFNGWFDNLENQVTEFTQVTTNMDLYAHYNKNTYTLSVNPNTGTWESSTSVQDFNLLYEDTKEIVNPTKKGYTFDNWTITGEGSSLDNNTFKMGYEDTQITANYHINQYTLTIEDSYTCDGNYQMDYNSTKEICNPQREGYTFDGWSYDSGNLDNGNFTIDDSNVTLKANWIVNSYKWIAYHKLEDIGGNSYTLVNADTNEGEANYGSEVTPNTNTYTGFISPQSKTLTIQTEDNYPPTTNVINYEYLRFKGILTIDSSGGNYNGETILENVYYQETKSINNPTKTCHTFTNWTVTGASSSITDNIFTMGVENATLTANYSLNQEVISYDPNGGTISTASDTINCGSQLTLPTPTRTGYTFTGWYDDPTSNNNKVGDGGVQVTINQTKTIYAHWSVNQYTITYNGNGGTAGRASDTGDYGSPITLPSATRSQSGTHTYSFAGWYDDANGGNLIGNAGDTYTIPTGKTLYAHWTSTARSCQVNKTSTAYSAWSATYNCVGGTGTMSVCKYNGTACVSGYVLSCQMAADDVIWMTGCNPSYEYREAGGSMSGTISCTCP